MLLVILLLLNCSSGWCQAANFPTGGENDSVYISINYIKLANEKLIEYYNGKKIISIQDSIINLQTTKYAELEAEVSVLQTKVCDSNEVNAKLNERMDKQNRKLKFLSGTALASALAFVVCLFLK